MPVPRVRLSRAAARKVAMGHPWVFREETTRHPPGTVVDLYDGRGERLGWGLADEGPIAFRALSRSARVPIEQWLRERVTKGDAMRGMLVDPSTDALRLISGAGDGLDGLVVDRYGELAVLMLYAQAWEPHLEHIVAALQRLPWCRTVFRRYGIERVDGREGGETLWGPAPAERVVVTECGVRWLVRPEVGQKTGLFLDQREHRALIRRWSAGRKVVNLFAYTGGFSVAAALGGATRVITVDLAPSAVEDAKENFRLNGLDPDAHGFEVADAFAWQARSPQDLVVVDPPMLARDQAAEARALSAYRSLHRHHGAQVVPGGLLATSSCTARIDGERWRGAASEGLAPTGDWSWLWESRQPPDHPVSLEHSEGRYLKFALLWRRG
jgi:23S rRNA (cytosine1962-C5)-methyltransferase